MSVRSRMILGAAAAVVLAAVVVGGILYLRDEDPVTDYDAAHRGRLHDHLHGGRRGPGLHPRRGTSAAAPTTAISTTIPYDRFLEIDAALTTDPSAVPGPIDRIRTTCYLDVEAAGPTVASSVPSTTVPA